MAPLASAPDWPALEAVLARDPGGRGVAGYRWHGRLLAAGQLEAAARSLAAGGEHVAIVTGFCVAGAEPRAAETDGPPGALYLARALTALGIDVTLVSDSIALPLLEAGRKLWDLEGVTLSQFPFTSTGNIDTWIDEFLASPPRSPPRSGTRESSHSNPDDRNSHEFLASPPSGGTRESFDLRPDDRNSHEFRYASGPPRRHRPLTHLVAIERAGPSHTLLSLAAQTRSGAAPIALFEREVPPDERDVCHNMRGEPIDAWTAPLHRLFDAIRARGLPIETIGLADGGNEIGAGSVPWEILRETIAQGPAGRVACRIATDHLLLAGVSNWAAYALAGSVAALAGRRELIADWNADGQRRLIETMVHQAGAVDGVTRMRQATVDGLPLETYLRTMSDILGVLTR